MLTRFVRSETVAAVVRAFEDREAEAFYATTTHNVWLTPPDPGLGADHVFNRQVVSTKGLWADDQISAESPLKKLASDEAFRALIAETVGLDQIHPYADPLSSVNMHVHRDGQELGWHFDNSAFAVTALFRAPQAGGVFEFVPEVRSSATGDDGHAAVADVLNGDRAIQNLTIAPGDLVIFRGRDSLHRVTPSVGPVSRLLAVFAYNERPGVSLSESAMETFYGRTP